MESSKLPPSIEQPLSHQGILQEFNMEPYGWTFESSLFALGILVGMLVMLDIGRRIGAKQLATDPEGARTGTGTIEAAVFALLGLLIAFTFSGALSRFDDRRHLIVEEANAIGTAYLRLDLLPVDSQVGLRKNFRQYVESRLGIYRKLPDILAAKAELVKATKLHREIWARAVAASQAEGAASSAAVLLLPALNQMIDITTTRVAALQLHPPLIIFGMLSLVALFSALLAGYGMAGAKSRRWVPGPVHRALARSHQAGDG
jgi:hypothetical protein